MAHASVGLTPVPETRVWPNGDADRPDPCQLWAIVLAGGAGIRLRPLTRLVCGDDRPKQYARLLGSRSLLRQTLDRTALAVPPERTVVATVKAQAEYIAKEFGGAPEPRVLFQPADRGTAAGILFPAHWVSWRDPGATVVVLPSDHFVGAEMAFMTHVLHVAGFVDRHPSRIVLLGVSPTEAEVEYGWIQPGKAIERVDGTLVSRVIRFSEKPSPEEARACLARGSLWNTFVMVAKVATLVDAGWEALPELSDGLARIEPHVDSEREGLAIERVYESLAGQNFSRDVLERCWSSLAVSRLPADVRWFDMGSPDRLLRGLDQQGYVPPWLRSLRRHAGMIGARL